MSIFNKKWLGKSTAYLLASISASSTLVQTLSEVKVFADGKDKISWWKNHESLLVAVLSWIFRKYNNAAEKVKMVLEYARSVFLNDSSSNKGTDEKLKNSDNNKSSDVGNELENNKYDDSSNNKGTDEKLKNSDNNNKRLDVDSKLKNSKYKDISSNEEDLKSNDDNEKSNLEVSSGSADSLKNNNNSVDNKLKNDEHKDISFNKEDLESNDDNEKSNLEVSSGSADSLKSNNNSVDNKLKNDEHKDIFFNKEDLELMKNFSEYISKPVNLDISDEDIEKVLDNAYGEKSAGFLLNNLDLERLERVAPAVLDSVSYPVLVFGKSLAKFVDQKQLDDISFTEGMNSSATLVDTYKNKKNVLVEQKISFNRSSDGTIFVKFLQKGGYYVLPLRTTLADLARIGRCINNEHFVGLWSFLDPLCLVDLFFVGDPYSYDNLEKDCTVPGTLKKLCDIFSEKSGCELLADSAKQAVALYEALESCYKKIFEKKTVSADDLCKEDFLFNYRKKLLKMILSEEIPEDCQLDKKVFGELRKHTVNYFNYLGGFDFKNQKKSQEDVLFNQQDEDQKKRKENVPLNSQDAGKIESDDGVGNELKNSEYEDISFNEEDLKLMKNFSEYTSKPVNLDLSDENIEKVLNSAYSGKNTYVLFENLDLKKVGVDEIEAEAAEYGVYNFAKNLTKLVVQEQFDDIYFTEGINSSTTLVDTYRSCKKDLVESKISFNRSSDGTIFVKFLYEDKYFTLPLRTTFTLKSRKRGINDFFVECWRFLDPLCLVDLFFVGDPYSYDNLEKSDTVLGTLKKLCDIFSQKPGCGMLADAAQQAVALYEALESCYKKIFEGKTVGFKHFSDKDFLLNYRKKLLKTVLSREIPEDCQLDKKVFDELRKHTVNYFNYLGGFDFKDQKKSQKDVLFNQQDEDQKKRQENVSLNSQDAGKTESDDGVGNKLKNSEYEDISFNEEDLKLMKNFLEYTSKPVNLDLSDENIEKVLNSACSGKNADLLFENLDLEKVSFNEKEPVKYAVRAFENSLAKLANQKRFGDISFTEGMHGSVTLVNTHEDREGDLVKEKISFNRSSDGTVFVKFLYKDKYSTLPLRVVLRGLYHSSKHLSNESFVKGWGFLDPLELVNLFFVDGPYIKDNLEKGDTVLGTLKKLCDIFSQKPGCGMLADAAQQAVALYEALESCYKKIFEGKTVSVDDDFCEEDFSFNYRKKLLKMILSGEIPEGCKIDKKVFDELRKHTVNYFNYLGGFDFKNQKKSQEGISLNSQSMV